jgi:glycosyltransferase involved in cell wall biosynthesis
MARKAIILASTRYWPEVRSGVESSAHALCGALAREGYRVIVVTSGIGGKHEVLPDGVEVRRYSSLSRDRRWWRFSPWLRFGHGWRVGMRVPGGVDGIICWSPQYVPWARVMFPHLPCVWVCHGIGPVCRLWDDPDGNGSKRSGLLRMLTYCQEGTDDAMERLACRLAHRTVVLSEGNARLLSRTWRFPRGKMVIIPHGVDSSQYVGRDGQERDEGLRIAFVGRVAPIKNVIYLLEAVALLPPQIHWEMRVAGDGPQLAECRALSERLRVQDRVHWEGWTNDPKPLLRWANVFALPSRWEGCPMALLEAMASGLPCIGLRWDAVLAPVDLSGMIVEGENGFSVDGRAPGAFAGALAHLAEHPDRRLRMGQASRRLAETRFSWTRIANAYVSLFGGNTSPGCNRIICMLGAC